MVAVAPSTVGQFTGICDREGKRIFEGDMLCFDDICGEKAKSDIVVRWCNHDQAYVIFNEALGPNCHYGDLGNFGEGKDLEIIGNIHDTQPSD